MCKTIYSLSRLQASFVILCKNAKVIICKWVNCWQKIKTTLEWIARDWNSTDKSFSSCFWSCFKTVNIYFEIFSWYKPWAVWHGEKRWGKIHYNIARVGWLRCGRFGPVTYWEDFVKKVETFPTLCSAWTLCPWVVTSYLHQLCFIVSSALSCVFLAVLFIVGPIYSILKFSYELMLLRV